MNGDGILTKAELIKGVKEHTKYNIDEEDWQKVFEVLDINQNGKIDYTEFIAGCMSSYVYTDESNLKKAFKFFDKDNDNQIDFKELKETLMEDNLEIQDEEINKLLSEIDLNEDGKVDFEEFKKMMEMTQNLPTKSK